MKLSLKKILLEIGENLPKTVREKNPNRDSYRFSQNSKDLSPEGVIEDPIDHDYNEIKRESAPYKEMGQIRILKQKDGFMAHLYAPEANVNLKFFGKDGSEALMKLAQKMNRMGLWE